MSIDEIIQEDQVVANCGRGVVEYRREGNDKHIFSADLMTFPGFTLDFTGVPESGRGGVASRLLSFAALYCFCNTFSTELTNRGAVVKSLTGRANPAKSKDDYGRTRIKRIFIDVEVDLDDVYFPILQECREIMEQGSLITYSLNESIEVDHVIRKNGDTNFFL
jgi:hypothetical protein